MWSNVIPSHGVVSGTFWVLLMVCGADVTLGTVETTGRAVVPGACLTLLLGGMGGGFCKGEGYADNASKTGWAILSVPVTCSTFFLGGIGGGFCCDGCSFCSIAGVVGTAEMCACGFGPQTCIGLA